MDPAPVKNAAPSARPEVIVEFLFERGLLYVAVRNIGVRPALGASVRFSEKLMGLGGSRDVGALAMFRNLEFLGPGRELVTLLDSASSWFARQQPTKIAVEISYRDSEGRRFSDTISHDLDAFRDLAFLDRPGPASDDRDTANENLPQGSTREVYQRHASIHRS